MPNDPQTAFYFKLMDATAELILTEREGEFEEWWEEVKNVIHVLRTQEGAKI